MDEYVASPLGANRLSIFKGGHST